MAEKKIGGRTFRVGTVLATDAIKLQVRLMKVIGGAVDRLPVILAGMGKKGAENPEAKAASDAAAVAALADIFNKANPDEVARLFSDIVAIAQMNGPSGSWEAVDIDTCFAGPHMKDLFPVTAFVLKEVLGDFFGGALASGGLSRVLGS